MRVFRDTLTASLLSSVSDVRQLKIRGSLATLTGGDALDTSLFELIAEDIEAQGYSIRPGALRSDIADALLEELHRLDADEFTGAGVGRGANYLQTEFVRTDTICWITGQTDGARAWLNWASRLQYHLNRRLFLGLFSFESHFSHYAPGDYYKRHFDAFRGEANRVLSIVVYLNPAWTPADAGELVIYRDDRDRTGIKVVPLLGTVVAFLSEDFPHEVLPAKRDRHSVAGWYRVNNTLHNTIDPPD